MQSKQSAVHVANLTPAAYSRGLSGEMMLDEVILRAVAGNGPRRAVFYTLMNSSDSRHYFC